MNLCCAHPAVRHLYRFGVPNLLAVALHGANADILRAAGPPRSEYRRQNLRDQIAWRRQDHREWAIKRALNRWLTQSGWRPTRHGRLCCNPHGGEAIYDMAVSASPKPPYHKSRVKKL